MKFGYLDFLDLFWRVQLINHINSGNGLALTGDSPLAESIMTHFTDAYDMCLQASMS